MKGCHFYNSLNDISFSNHAVGGLLHFILAVASDHLLFIHFSAPFPVSCVLCSLNHILQGKQMTLKTPIVLIDNYFFYYWYGKPKKDKSSPEKNQRSC